MGGNGSLGDCLAVGSGEGGRRRELGVCSGQPILSSQFGQV